MIDEIISGISNAIYQAYGDGYNIYTVTSNQDFIEPCFAISAVNNTNEAQLGSFSSGQHRYFRSNIISVKFFPDPNNLDAKLECNEVKEVLFEILEYINAGTDPDTWKPYLIRGTDMHGEFTDGVLTFLVNYDMIMRKVKTPDLMEDLTIDKIEVMNDLTINYRKQV